MIPKFRAWLKDDKKMIDVDEIHWDEGQLDFIGDGITFMRIAEKIVLMQSTGLFDKNGQEIFEGDILYGNDGEDFWEFVEFDEENAKWVRTDLNGYKLDLSENVTELEVVGNVYQNPELLEVIR
ncbi:YopX family protein [Streptococcus gordonii]|uniref:YopX family protein n=1 Tax=Streptococcus gordonii TaxID=1302 RepID=UPI0022843E59|nr:YopX family protein [Streptococcus gordonii]MCY7133723.1 YopX family protein [Streptococcus gordonii]